MHEHDHNSRWLVINTERCSGETRALASQYGWPVVESVDAQEAARIVIAMAARRVLVESRPSLTSLPSIAATVANLDSAQHVACIAPALTKDAERFAGQHGIQIFDSLARFEAWRTEQGAAAPDGAPADELTWNRAVKVVQRERGRSDPPQTRVC